MGALVQSVFASLFFEQQKIRNRVVRIALEWLNTPYHPHAKLKHVGCDCATLLTEVYAEAGVVPPIELEHYSPEFMLHRSEEIYLQTVAKYGREIPIERLGVGDVVVWKFGRCFSHGAIVLEWPRIIHAVMGRGVLLGDASNDADLLGRPVKFFSPWA